jgi:membrane protease YdiL (CAAX protease family)
MLQEEINICDSQGDKQELKNITNKITGGLLIYELIMFTAVIFIMIIKAVFIFINNHGTYADKLFKQMISKEMTLGTSSLIGISFGIFFLFQYFKDDITNKVLFEKTDRKMKQDSFIGILTVFMSAQLLFTFLSLVIEKIVNSFGFSLLEQIEMATNSSKTISMFLYASVFGPITEEIVFRGFVLKSFQKYGKIFAIVISAILFGAFHGNFLQGIYATAVGLVLGYVTVEYSIGWSIILHIINNLVFGDILSHLIEGQSEMLQNVVTYSINIIFFIGGLVILFINRGKIKVYLKDNKTSGRKYKYVFTSCLMIIFIVIQIGLSILCIKRI